MVKMKQTQMVLCLLLGAAVVFGFGEQAVAKKKESAAQQLIKRLQEDIKGYQAKLKTAQDKMTAANEAGEEVEPLIEPKEKEMREWKEEMDSEQRKRIAASREMKEKLEADEGIEEARVALEKAEDARDTLMAELMPKIKAQEKYQELAGARDAAARYLEKVKREKSELDIPYAATELAKTQGALGTYVQAQLTEVPEYKAVEDAVSEAQSHRRNTEREATERYRRESGLDVIDERYEERQKAYRQAREDLRDLERKFKSLRSDYEDAEKDAKWANRRIEIANSRIKALQK